MLCRDILTDPIRVVVGELGEVSSWAHLFFKLTTEQVLVFDQAHVRLTFCKQGRVVWTQVDANPQLKINQINFLLVYKCFSLHLF